MDTYLNWFDGWHLPPIKSHVTYCIPANKYPRADRRSAGIESRRSVSRLSLHHTAQTPRLRETKRKKTLSFHALTFHHFFFPHLSFPVFFFPHLSFPVFFFPRLSFHLPVMAFFLLLSFHLSLSSSPSFHLFVFSPLCPSFSFHICAFPPLSFYTSLFSPLSFQAFSFHHSVFLISLFPPLSLSTSLSFHLSLFPPLSLSTFPNVNCNPPPSLSLPLSLSLSLSPSLSLSLSLSHCCISIFRLRLGCKSPNPKFGSSTQPKHPPDDAILLYSVFL
ncbi:unnamed protein product [Acanthosepion pharaonis]|uniref:Uncharacterized protein n=1 Tax=Acanthosepion pharaonis TaxID=158019 RepID=A0A812DR51_ACAPH|nr:unnamed protein product [Sepia pharaonis]